MRKTITFALLAVLLASAVSAAPVIMELGPYHLYFDPDSMTNHTVQAQEPIPSKTYAGIDYVDYSIIIDHDDGWIVINVTDYHSPVPADNKVTKEMTRKAPLGLAHYLIVDTREELIDRHSGFVTTFEDLSGKDVFQAAYWLDRYLDPGGYLGQSSCRIASSSPWEATKKLLTTVHLERPTPEPAATLTAGPYNLSFDLGETGYAVVIEDAERGKAYDRRGYTAYQVGLKSGNKAAVIRITDYDDARAVNIESDKLLLENSLRIGGCGDIEVSERMIDGQRGVLGTGEDKDHQIIYQASYWIGQTPPLEGGLGNTRCDIESTYNWIMTDRLLNTLHVERIG